MRLDTHLLKGCMYVYQGYHRRFIRRVFGRRAACDVKKKVGFHPQDTKKETYLENTPIPSKHGCFAFTTEQIHPSWGELSAKYLGISRSQLGKVDTYSLNTD